MGIFNFNKKEENVIKGYQTETVEGAEIWMVSWDARYGEFHGEKKRVAKGFLNEDDAKDFKQSLLKAQELLHYTENLHIDIEKQS